MPEKLQFPIIQEWFDSVGIFIHVKPLIDVEDKLKWFCSNVNDVSVELPEANYRFKIRNEALKAAIIKANELYNSRNE